MDGTCERRRCFTENRKIGRSYLGYEKIVEISMNHHVEKKVLNILHNLNTRRTEVIKKGLSSVPKLV